LPEAITSSAMPDCGKVRLNIDFDPARKILPGVGRRARRRGRQNLPGAAEIAGSDRQKLPLFIKAARPKQRKTAKNPVHAGTAKRKQE
jgi:hypothetical protein